MFGIADLRNSGPESVQTHASATKPFEIDVEMILFHCGVRDFHTAPSCTLPDWF